MERAHNKLLSIIDTIIDRYDLSGLRYTHGTLVRLISSVRYIGYQYMKFLSSTIKYGELLPLMYYHGKFLLTLKSLIDKGHTNPDIVDKLLYIEQYIKCLGVTGDLYCYVNDICAQNDFKRLKDTYCAGHSSSSLQSHMMQKNVYLLELMNENVLVPANGILAMIIQFMFLL